LSAGEADFQSKMGEQTAQACAIAWFRQLSRIPTAD
jgi:hypothetical protein